MTTRSPELVLHCVAGGGLYGIERFVLNLLPALTDVRCAVELVSIQSGTVPGHDSDRHPAGQALTDAYAATGGIVHPVHMPSRLSPAGLQRLGRILWRLRPSLVHMHGYKAAILAGPLARLLRIPVVMTYHSEAKQVVGLKAQLVVETMVVRRFQGFAAVSAPIRDELISRGVKPSRIRVIPSGVPDRAGEAARFHRTADRASTLFTAARLSEEKNLDLLIEAVARLRQRFPAIRLRIAGEGPCRSELEDAARQMGVSDRVEFLGFLTDILGPLISSDCFVLPSRTEGMPTALLEAMSVGCPVVASAVGSIPELAEDGRNLVLVEPNDTERLVEAIARVFSDPAYARTLAANARVKFERDHTLAAMANSYVRFYESVLGRPVSS